MTRTNTNPMTRTNTEQERAEFEERFKHLDLTKEPDAWGAPRYKHDAISLAWEAWQAARRAPTPPPGYRLQPLSGYDAMCAFISAAPQPAAQGLELANCKGDKWLTVVYRDIQPGDESRAIGEHPKVSALSWSHALHDRDAALAAQAKQGERP